MNFAKIVRAIRYAKVVRQAIRGIKAVSKKSKRQEEEQGVDDTICYS
jgi:hypothetical protein